MTAASRVLDRGLLALYLLTLMSDREGGGDCQCGGETFRDAGREREGKQSEGRRGGRKAVSCGVGVGWLPLRACACVRGEKREGGRWRERRRERGVYVSGSVCLCVNASAERCREKERRRSGRKRKLGKE